MQANLKRRVEELAALRDGSRVEGDFARQAIAQSAARAEAAEAASAKLQATAAQLQAEAVQLRQELTSSQQAATEECVTAL